MIPLEDDDFCFVCGRTNPAGLHLKFMPKKDGGIMAGFTPLKIHQGYKDIVHGGIIATVLDEAMVKAAIAEGWLAVTAECTVRFKEPLIVGQETVVEAEVKLTGRRLLEAEARLLRVSDGKAIALAKGKLLIGKDSHDAAN